MLKCLLAGYKPEGAPETGAEHAFSGEGIDYDG